MWFKNKLEQTFHNACEKGDINVVKDCIKKGIVTKDVELTIINIDNLFIMKLLINSGFDISFFSLQEALVKSIELKNEELVDFFLEKGGLTMSRCYSLKILPNLKILQKIIENDNNLIYPFIVRYVEKNDFETIQYLNI